MHQSHTVLEIKFLNTLLRGSINICWMNRKRQQFPRDKNSLTSKGQKQGFIGHIFLLSPCVPLRFSVPKWQKTWRKLVKAKMRTDRLAWLGWLQTWLASGAQTLPGHISVLLSCMGFTLGQVLLLRYQSSIKVGHGPSSVKREILFPIVPKFQILPILEELRSSPHPWAACCGQGEGMWWLAKPSFSANIWNKWAWSASHSLTCGWRVGNGPYSSRQLSTHCQKKGRMGLGRQKQQLSTEGS